MQTKCTGRTAIEKMLKLAEKHNLMIRAKLYEVKTPLNGFYKNENFYFKNNKEIGWDARTNRANINGMPYGWCAYPIRFEWVQALTTKTKMNA